MPELRPSRDPEILIGFLARVGWEICQECDGHGGTATRDEVRPCGDCGGFCLVEIEGDEDEDEGPGGSAVSGSTP